MDLTLKEKEGIKYKIVVSPMIAKELLIRYNHPIVDIKPHRERSRETVFVFEQTEQFTKDLTTISDYYKANKEKYK